MSNEKQKFNSAAFLNTKELAQRWGIHHRTLNNWRILKKGPRYTKLGDGSVRYAVSDIITYEQSKKFLR